MGCSSANATEEKKNNDTSSILTVPNNNQKNQYHIKRKGGRDYEEPVSKLSK